MRFKLVLLLANHNGILILILYTNTQVTWVLCEIGFFTFILEQLVKAKIQKLCINFTTRALMHCHILNLF